MHEQHIFESRLNGGCNLSNFGKIKKKPIALLHNKDEGGVLGHFKNDQISTP